MTARAKTAVDRLLADGGLSPEAMQALQAASQVLAAPPAPAPPPAAAPPAPPKMPPG